MVSKPAYTRLTADNPCVNISIHIGNSLKTAAPLNLEQFWSYFQKYCHDGKRTMLKIYGGLL
jgi:hypothetical protein